MNEQTNDATQEGGLTPPAEQSPRARTELRLIGLVFLLPLVLMFVTAVVCIAVVLARH